MNALKNYLDETLRRMTGSSAVMPGVPPRHAGLGGAALQGPPLPPLLPGNAAARVPVQGVRGLELPRLHGAAPMPRRAPETPSGTATEERSGGSGQRRRTGPVGRGQGEWSPEQSFIMSHAAGVSSHRKELSELESEMAGLEEENSRILSGMRGRGLGLRGADASRAREHSAQQDADMEAIKANEARINEIRGIIENADTRELRAAVRGFDGFAREHFESEARRGGNERLAREYGRIDAAALERELEELSEEYIRVAVNGKTGYGEFFGIGGGAGRRAGSGRDYGGLPAIEARMNEIREMLEPLAARSEELYRDAVQHQNGAIGVLPARYAHIPDVPGFEKYVRAIDQGTANRSFSRTMERDAWSVLPPIRWIADLVEGGDEALRGRILSDKEGREIGVYAMMTPMEIGVLGYLTEHEGAGAGQRFLDDIMPALDYRSSMYQENHWREIADESPLNASILSVPMNVIGGLSSSADLLAQNLNKALGGGPVNYHSPAQRAASGGGHLRSQVGGNIAEHSDLGAFFYNALMSGADSMAAAYLGPGGMAMAMLGASAGSERARELGRRGASDGQALMGGIAAGAFEALFEGVSIGNFRRLGQIEFSGVRSAVRNAAVSMGVNASEEFFTEAANMVYDVFANGEFSDFEMSVRGHMDEGLTEREAKSKAIDDMVFQAFEAAASGMVVGGMFSGVNTAQQVRNRNAARAGIDAGANPLLDLIGEPHDGKQGAEVGRPGNGSARFSISDSFASDFDSWVASGKPDRGQLYIGTTSEALQSIGIKDQQIEWDTSKINKIQRDHPGMSDNVLRQVPGIIESPVIVMDSKTQPNRVTMFGEVYNDNGLPVMAVLELMPTRYGNLVLDMIKVANAYSKDSSATGTQSIIDKSNILYIDPNNNRTDTWLTRNQLQLPFSVSKYGSIGRVSYIGRDVKGNFTAEAANAPMEGWKQKLQGLSLPEPPGSVNTPKHSMSGAGVLPGLSGNGIAAGPGASQMAAAAPAGRGLQGLSLPSPWSAVEKSGRDTGAAREAIAVADRLSDALDVPVLFFKSPDATKSNINGYYKDGAIHVNAQGGNPAAQVIAHELTHHIERAGAYNELADAVFGFMQEDGGDVGGEQRRTALLYERAGVNLTAAEVNAEIVAKFVETRLLTNERDIMRLAESKPSLARRILDWVEGVLAKLRGRGAEHAELVRMRGLYAKALAEVSRGQRDGIGSSYSVGESKINSVNPTGGLFVDYDPQHRASAALGDNMTTYDKTAGLDADEIITIYRGVDRRFGQGEIAAGDYVTTSYELAKTYAGDGNVISRDVKASEILDDMSEPLGEEYIYRPAAARSGPEAYAGRSLSGDSGLYTYDFLTAQPDMEVTVLPDIADVTGIDGRVVQSDIASSGIASAEAAGRIGSDGKVYVDNRYTNRGLRVDTSTVRHGLSGKLSRLLTNARLGAVAGSLIKNAIPVNALQNESKGVAGSYAMAALARDSSGGDYVAIVTVEQRSGNVDSIELMDVAHSISGRNNRNSQADTKSQGVYPIKAASKGSPADVMSQGAIPSTATTITIRDFLEIVNSTHQSILSNDVLRHLGEAKKPDGHYTDRAKFSIADPQPPGFDEMGRERRVDPRWDVYRRDMASLHENAPPEGMRGAGDRATLPMLSGNGIEAGGGRVSADVPARAGESAPASALSMLTGGGTEAGGGYPVLNVPGRSKVSVPKRKVMQAAERAAARKMADDLLDAFHIPVGSKKAAREAVAEYVADLNAKRLDTGSDIRAFDALWDAGRVMSDEGSRAYTDVARELRGRRIFVDPRYHLEFGDKESWNSLRNAAQFRHKVVFTGDSSALPLDAAYAELAESFPGFFRAGETDARTMIEGIVEVMELARPERAALEDSARMFGGEEAVQSYKRQMYGEFYDAAREYYNAVHGGRDARLDAIKAERMERMGYGGRLVDAVSEHMEAKAAFAPVMPSRRREGFRGSQMMDKMGVRIANSPGNYAFTDSMLRNHEAARDISKQLDNAVRRLNPTKAEKAFAQGIGDGTYTQADIPGTMNAGKVMELADYYTAKGSVAGETIHQRGRDIRRELALKMEGLVPDLESLNAPAALLQNVSNPEKLTHRVFGYEQGEAINNEIFYPVIENEAERKRWSNEVFDGLREHEGRDGKLRKLSKTEDALVQMVIEGQAAAEAVRGLEDADAVMNAAENVRKAKDYDSKARDDNMREFGLDKERMDLAERYAVYLDAKDRMAGGKADAVMVENAARAYRQFYDDMHRAFNEFLAAHGREPIGFIPGYAPHMQPTEAINSFGEFLRSVGNDGAVEKLSAAIAGRTKGFRPNMRWNPHFQSRYGDKTDYSITRGAQRYVEFGSDVFFHTGDIMRVRALADHVRRLSAPEEMREMLSWAERVRNGSPAEKAEFLVSNGDIKAGQELSPQTISKLIDAYIDGAYSGIRTSKELSNYVMWLDNYANSLAGKQSMFDRGNEELLGRESLNISGRFAQAFSLSRVAGSMTTVINQFSQHANIVARTGVRHTAASLNDWALHVKRDPGILAWEAGSDFLADRKGIEHLADMGIWRNATDAMFIPIRIVDYYNSFLAVRSRYNQEIAAGKSHDAAMKRADEFARMLIGSRAKGSRPAVYESKNPAVRMLTVFQREVSQNWAYHNDLIRGREFRRLVEEHGEGKAKLVVAGTIAGTLIAAFLQNLASDELTGVEPAQFDILGYITHFFAAGASMRRNDWLAMVIDNCLEEFAGERPFGTERDAPEGGFDWERAVDETKRRASYRIPYARNIAGAAGWGDGSRPALPDIAAIGGGLGEAFSFDDVPVLERLRAGVGAASEILPGGLQLRRSFEGIDALSRGGRYRGSGDSEKLQYPVGNENPLDVMRGAMFGMRGMPETGRHFASGAQGLTAVQTELVRSLVDDGADRFEVYDAIQAWRRADADAGGDDGIDSLERNRMRHDVVRSLNFDDGLRLEFYVGLSNADKRGEQFGELLGLGLGLDDVLDVYEEYLRINSLEGMNAMGQAAAFAHWVDGQGFGHEQSAALKDTFRYHSHIPAEATRYESLVAAGITGDDALALVREFAGLSPERGRVGVTDMQRYRAIDESGLTEREKVAALGSFMGDAMLTAAGNPTQYAKMLDAVGTGLSVGDYLDLHEEGSGAVDRYLSLAGAGVDPADAYGLAFSLMSLEPLPGEKAVTDLQRQRSAVDMIAGDEQGQLAALSALMGEEQMRRFEVALDFGISPDMLVSYREFARDIDDNGNVNQAEARRAVEMIPGLSREQRAALFQLQNLGWRTNPYSSRVAGRVRSEFADDSDSGASRLPGLSLPSLPQLPSLPELPGLSLPSLPELPGLSLPSLPELPSLPRLSG